MANLGQIHLHRSNRTENLLEELVSIMKQDPLPPLQEEWVVVQGAGMERWLSIAFAKRFGICMNVRFPYPQTMVEVAMSGVEGLRERGSGLPADSLFWVLAKEVVVLSSHPQCEELRAYLSSQDKGGVDPRKRFQLAERLQKIFGRYALYRPQLLQTWLETKEGGWQGHLWRHLNLHYKIEHPGQNLKAFLNALAKNKEPLPGLPKRVFLFGISSLPPLYTRIISALASQVEIHLFVPSPSQEYWADLQAHGHSADLVLSQGNPLLASMGKLSGDFQQVLEDHALYEESGKDLYQDDSDAKGMLSILQSDILHLHHRGIAKATGMQEGEKALPLEENDSSLLFHSCHSPMREVEALHDYLIDVLEKNTHLEAQDVVVMAPDIEVYAPLINAIFGGDKEERFRIPYRIVDRNQQANEPLVQGFFKISQLLQGRFPLSEVMDVLTLDLIALQFEMDEQELALVRKWLEQSGVRWAWDKEHREEADQPGFNENTWSFGLDRLLMGYAMDGEGSDCFQGVAPYDDMEGSSTLVLGKLLNFCHQIKTFRVESLQDKDVVSWCSWLQHFLKTMLYQEESNILEHTRLFEVIDSLAQEAEKASFREEVGFAFVISKLEETIGHSKNSRGFLSGGVTFCQMMPMRSIAFPVVCMLGLDDGAFPRSSTALPFDEMVRHPKVGDRSLRDEDRYLFLEAILSAREKLLISYVGRSVYTNAKLPPSPLVGELLDVLSDSFMVSKGSVRERLIVQHALQPFSPRYFNDKEPSLFSYSAGLSFDARELSSSAENAASFLDAPLALQEEGKHELSLEALAFFFTRPVQYFLNRRLSLYLSKEREGGSDREAVSLEGLDKYKVGAAILGGLEKGEEMDGIFEALSGKGVLPLGALGRCEFEPLFSSVQDLYRSAQEEMKTQSKADVEISLLIGTTLLRGRVSGIRSSGRVHRAYRRLGKKSEIGFWIEHLALCAFAPASIERCTHLFGRSELGNDIVHVRFSEIENPKEILESLVELYWLGQQVPLCFFPGSAKAYVKKKLALDGKGIEGAAEEALARAVKEFIGQAKYPGELFDAYVSHVFRGIDCLKSDFRPFEGHLEAYYNFIEIASRVYGPLLAHRKENKL